MNKQQITNLLGAGTISGLALALALMFGGGGNAQATSTAPAETNNAITKVVTADSYSALVEQNTQLQEAVGVLQDREAQYQEQLTLAQNTLDEQAMGAEASYGEGEYEEEEEYEEESEAHEEEEEHEEDDD